MNADEVETIFNLVELTTVHTGEVHRSKQMTVKEARERNAAMSGTVMAWMTTEERQDFNEKRTGVKRPRFAPNPPNWMRSGRHA